MSKKMMRLIEKFLCLFAGHDWYRADFMQYTPYRYESCKKCGKTEER